MTDLMTRKSAETVTNAASDELSIYKVDSRKKTQNVLMEESGIETQLWGLK